MEPILMKLSDEAKQFFALLHSLEYLPPPIEKRLLHELLFQSQENIVIELEALKRSVAILLFEHKETLSLQAQMYLQKDWNIIFGP